MNFIISFEIYCRGLLEIENDVKSVEFFLQEDDELIIGRRILLRFDLSKYIIMV